MKMNRAGTLTVVVALAMLGGCVGHTLTGGGHFASTSGVAGEVASFHIEASECGANSPLASKENLRGKVRQTLGTYTLHDKSSPYFPAGGIKIRGNILSVDGLPDGLVEPKLAPSLVTSTGIVDFYVIAMNYESTNPHYPGSGGLFGFVRASAVHLDVPLADNMHLQFGTGPYEGIIISSNVTGKFQAHVCH